MTILDSPSKNYDVALHSLQSALNKANLRSTKTPFPPDGNLISVEDWRREFYTYFGKSASWKAKSQRFARARKFLESNGYTRELAGSVWQISHTA